MLFIQYKVINLAAICAAINSKRGRVIFFKGATLDLAITTFDIEL
ncbi:hypothetical protein T07_2487 [Trichinella nelsoni]|uniref:Uncharacterized protein n=1 Tax=Trichinella nelsoni TaxID=6336 RepID=A0A0V0RAG0_9BILA|nr:hypothetical protein T07_2487 [Trichinella nelsoni]